MLYFRNEGHYRSDDLSRDKFLSFLSHGGKKNLAGLAKFDFRILWLHMKTSNRVRSFGMIRIQDHSGHGA